MQDAGIDPSYSMPTLRHLHSGTYTAAPTQRHLHSGIYSLMTHHEYGVPATDAERISEATIRARAEIHEIVATLRRLGSPWEALAVPTGEAAGQAAAASLRQGVLPHELSWAQVRQATPS